MPSSISPITAIRGMHDLLPAESIKWQFLEQSLSNQASSFGYQQIRTPIVEKLELFKRSIGEVTDIVEKEMYEFADQHGDRLCLRPENTASCVRAAIEHGLLYRQQQKFWYMGPMFRHERPQKGRYRQFHQFGVEVFGYTEIDAEIEVLLLAQGLWQKLGLKLQLEINSLGGHITRQNYKTALVDYLSTHEAKLDAHSRRRLTTNPLRILDSKNPDLVPLLADAPKLKDYLNPQEKERFRQMSEVLSALNIPFVTNDKLVRGLDYYNDLVFEWTTEQLGSQATVCAGGRYDNLVAQLGGQPTPAVGFAIGLERLLLLTEQQNQTVQTLGHSVDIYFINLVGHAQTYAWKLVQEFRAAYPDLCISMSLASGALKKQLKKANQANAKYAFILGEQEFNAAQILVKNMQTGEQRTVGVESIDQIL